MPWIIHYLRVFYYNYTCKSSIIHKSANCENLYLSTFSRKRSRRSLLVNFAFVVRAGQLPCNDASDEYNTAVALAKEFSVAIT